MLTDVTIGNDGSIFSYRGVRRFLGDLHGRFGIFPLRHWSSQPGVILRHDVDLDLDAALQLAREEAEVGVAASFFLLTTAETYNLSARESRRKVQEMDSLGAEIGLHFDPTVYDGDDAGLPREVRREADVIEQLIGRRVDSVSLHNPSVRGRYPLFAGFRNAYDPAIFSRDRYLSDSRMQFWTDPRTFFEGARTGTYQLLLHPMHYSQDGGPYPAPMVRYLCAATQSVERIFRVNETFREAVGDRFVRHVAAAAAHWPDSGTE